MCRLLAVVFTLSLEVGGSFKFSGTASGALDPDQLLETQDEMRLTENDHLYRMGEAPSIRSSDVHFRFLHKSVRSIDRLYSADNLIHRVLVATSSARP